ncbi:MAG: dicarboxylate/amino acid:cation symporter [Aerococcus sp.]|nr:dicarboxylate/amino acid:cation symporter [Aerococcus sp.]
MLMSGLALIAAVVGFFLIFFEKQHHQSFLVRVLTAMVLGVVIGLVFRGNTDYVVAVGHIYVNVLSSLVVPVLFFSIIYTVSSLEDIHALTRIGGKAIGFLSLHNVLGSLIAMVMVFLFHIGQGASVAVPDNAKVAEVPPVLETIISFFPSNIVDDAANNRVVPVIVFSALVAIAILLYSKKEDIKPFTDFIAAGNQLTFKVVSLVTGFTPYAVLALIANRVSGMNMEDMGSMLIVLIAVFAATIFHSVVTTSALLFFIGRLNPWHYLKKFFPTWMIGFTTQSSVGSIPASVESQENMGVPEQVASFAASIGSSFGMPGCAAIWPVTLALFTVNALGINYGLKDYLVLIVVALLVSAGTVGVPGIATITATAVFTAMGLPVEVIILMTPISAIADMARTATNVSAGASSGVLIAATNDELDRDQYQRENRQTVNVES